MTYADRVSKWNRWYDNAPQEWRFQIVFWFMVTLGAINMTLTIADGFPFGLLVLFGVIWLTSVRMPHVLGWIKHPEGHEADAHESGARVEIEPAEWIIGVNQWYETVPEFNRPFYLFGALLVVGWINMILTIHYAFTFGLLFLIGLLAVIVIRAPYVAGWYKVPDYLATPLALPPQAPRILPPLQSTGQPVVLPAAAVVPPETHSHPG